MAIRVLASDGMDKAGVAKLQELGYEVVEQFYEPEELAKQVKEFDVLVVRSATKVRAPIIDAAAEAGRLKLIIRGGVGIDNIDAKYAEEKGIKVTNTPRASSESVAEMALAHMFALARHLHIANVTMREGKWEKNAYKGIELSGKTLGLIGCGRIGRFLGDKAAALGMTVLYTDIVGAINGNPHCYCVQDDIFTKSDFISLHVPTCDKPLIDRDSIAKMKDGAYIINTSRGMLIDEDALVEALDSGKLGGAGLDVYAEEPPKNEKILKHPKISMTPHVGGSTKEAQKKIGAEIVQIISDFFA